MAHKKGFFAEMHRQAQQQVRLQEQRRRAAAREHQAAVSRAAQAQRAAERAHVAAARASEADMKRAEREAAAAHVEAKQAEVEALNVALTERYEELDSILPAALEVDDYVDLEMFRVFAEHPPFGREDLRIATSKTAPPPEPGWPVKPEAQAPKGFFGRQKKLAAAQAIAEEQYAADYARWQQETESLPARRQAHRQRYEALEEARKSKLAEETAKYEKEYAAREAVVTQKNAELDEFISALGYGVVDAVQEYVSIVLAKSVYPDLFPVSHSAEFDPITAELTMRTVIPGPDMVPSIKAYKYTKASDEVTAVQLSQKVTKERYAGIVHAVTLRSLHEVFEADRRGLVQGISLELGTNAITPATGKNEDVPFVAVAVRREAFESLDLSAVVPEATLAHLGAAVSKNPLALNPIDSSGVRGAK